MRGQISIEYIAIVATVLFLTIPLLYYGISKSTEDTRLSEADLAAESMRSLVDKVYALGKGTKDFTWVTFPSGIQNIYIGGPANEAGPNEIVIELGIYGGTNEILKSTIVPSMCSIGIPKGKGTYRIFAEYIDQPNCKVNITCGTGSCT